MSDHPNYLFAMPLPSLMKKLLRSFRWKIAISLWKILLILSSFISWYVFQVTARISIERPEMEDQSRSKASSFQDRASQNPHSQDAMFYDTLLYYLVLWCSDTLIYPSLILSMWLSSCWMKKLILSLKVEWRGWNNYFTNKRANKMRSWYSNKHVPLISRDT